MNLKICLVYFFVITVVNSQNLSPIPRKVNVGEKTYYVETFFKASWYRAAQFCRYHDLRLASINNQQENDKLEEQLKNSSLETDNFWTSGNDLAQAKSFVWMSNGEDFTYQNWASGQPDGWVRPKEVEHCVEISDRDGTGIKWNDALCSLDHHFICEN